MKESKDNIFFHSFYLIFSKLSLGISGIIFWWAASRFFSIEDIGLGSALISASSLLIFMSSLGIIPTFISFLPKEEDKDALLGTLWSFSFFLLILFCLIFLIILSFCLPQFYFLKLGYLPVVFCAFVLIMQTYQILDGIFIAFKATQLVFFKSLIQNILRIGIIVTTISFGGFGIFTANCLAALIAVIIAINNFTTHFYSFRLKFNIDISILKKILPFSLVNFLNAMSLRLPGMVFPLIILALFSKKEAGFFYIPWMFFYVYCEFIIQIMYAFLMQSAHKKKDKKTLKKVIGFVFCLALLGFVFFTFFGDKLLLFFKKDFSIASDKILKILFSSIFFFVVNQVFLTLKNIEKKVFEFGSLSSLIIFSMVIFSFVFIPDKGLEGIPFAWLFANMTGNVFIVALLIKNKLKTRIGL